MRAPGVFRDHSHPSTANLISIHLLAWFAASLSVKSWVHSPSRIRTITNRGEPFVHCHGPKFFSAIAVSAILLFTNGSLRAQESGATLSGVVTDASGKPVSNAKVTIVNAATAQSTETETDSSGHYSLPNLAPGDYDVSCSVSGVGMGSAKITFPRDGTA